MTETLKMTVEEMEDILEEVWSTLRVDTISSSMYGEKPTVQDLFRLDQRLQEIQMSALQRRSDELSTWLRYTFTWSDSLPTWRPLFNTTYAIMLQRFPRAVVEQDLLVGLFPKD